MAFLTLDAGGANQVDVECEAFEEVDPVEVGEGGNRAFAGNLRNCTRGLKRTWNAVTIGVDTTLAASVLLAIGNFKTINCTGDAFLGTTVSTRVKYKGRKPITIGDMVAGYNFLWQITLSFEEQ